MVKRWTILSANDHKIKSLRESLKINEVICKILVQRSVDNFEKAKDFFRPNLEQLHDPFLMKDMQLAVDRILSAISKKEKILVYGDYDVDGTTSVACMFQFLLKIYDAAFIDFYIPHRYREGYGISKAGIDFAKENKFDLIISLDCGIKSADLISYAKSLGIDFIVCDHHLPDSILPPAIAILNPKQIDCNYPYKELCGCGVGFKLIVALSQTLNLDESFYIPYLDLVATAIAADIVSITGENRILTYHGLEQINTNPSAGIKSLIQIGDLKNKLSITNVVFVIAPRVNAAGRMDDAKKAVQLFIEKDIEKSFQLAKELQIDNTDRKEADSTITEEALAIIDADESLIQRNTTVVFKEHWHKGVVGIVASRLTEKYYRPTVVLTQSGEIVSGSARSVVGYNLYEAIHACREYLLGYGGHFAAAGLSMLPENVNNFSNKFEEVVSSTIDANLLIPEIIIDAEVSFADLSISFYKILCQMEPFGPDNMKPVFITRNVISTPNSRVLKEAHIKFDLKQDNRFMNGIGFNMADKFDLLTMNKPIDIVYTLDLNEWNGNTDLQLKMIDFRLSAQ